MNFHVSSFSNGFLVFESWFGTKPPIFGKSFHAVVCISGGTVQSTKKMDFKNIYELFIFLDSQEDMS